jgi:hypothetical protein
MQSTIRMSASTKAILQTDPKLAEDLNCMIEELMSEDRAELEKKLNPEGETETEDEEEGAQYREMIDASREGEYENEDRWNCARPGREANAVNKIKEIIAHLHETVASGHAGGVPLIDNCPGNAGYQGWDVVASNFEDPTIKKCGKKFGIACVAWLMLAEHKLDGMGGHWSSGCFGSFWADIALTIPDLNGTYCGFRVAFNPKPCPSRPAWFLIDYAETLVLEVMRNRPTTALHAEFGVRKNWGMMLWSHIRSFETEQEKEAKEQAKAEKAKRDAEKAEKDAKKQEKLAEKAEKHYKEEMERQARERRFAAKLAEERRAQEEEIRVAREAEFAQRVSALAEREKAAKEQERLAKLEQARISEENRKLKAQQKEAERLAKFVNKKK